MLTVHVDDVSAGAALVIREADSGRGGRRKGQIATRCSPWRCSIWWVVAPESCAIPLVDSVTAAQVTEKLTIRILPISGTLVDTRRSECRRRGGQLGGALCSVSIMSTALQEEVMREKSDG